MLKFAAHATAALFGLALFLGSVQIASASLITFETPAGSTSNSLPVDAKATFTTSAGQITVVLENLQADPRATGQVLSSFLFTVSTGQKTGTLASSSAIPRSIADNGTFTDSAAVATGWSLDTSGSALMLHVLGTPQAPSYTIIGPAAGNGMYDNANASIAGNGPHNPFLGLSATFVLNVPGVTAQSTITDVTFSFNTAPGYDVGGHDTTPTPEPATMALLAIGGGLLAWRRRRQAA